MSKDTQNRLINDYDTDLPSEPVVSAPRAPAREAPLRHPKIEGRGPYPGRRQVTAHIDRQLFLWLKSISAQTEKPMVELFTEALDAYVRSFAAKKKFGDPSTTK